MAYQRKVVSRQALSDMIAEQTGLDPSNVVAIQAGVDYLIVTLAATDEDGQKLISDDGPHGGLVTYTRRFILEGKKDAS